MDKRTMLILHDNTGQPWAISVRPDGQLLTAKYPDGEPVAFARMLDADAIGREAGKHMARILNRP